MRDSTQQRRATDSVMHGRNYMVNKTSPSKVGSVRGQGRSSDCRHAVSKNERERNTCAQNAQIVSMHEGVTHVQEANFADVGLVLVRKQLHAVGPDAQPPALAIAARSRATQRQHGAR